MSTDEQQIRKLVAEWSEATAAADVERLRPLMTEDVVFLAASSPEPMRGREAFLNVFGEITKNLRITTACDIREIAVSGDLAYCWNYLLVTVTAKSSQANAQFDAKPAVVRKGHVLSVLRRTETGWAIERDANLLATE